MNFSKIGAFSLRTVGTTARRTASAPNRWGGLMPRLVSMLAVVPALLGVAYAQSPTCACPKGPAVHESFGGDGAPLNWRFEVYEKTAGGPGEKRVLCYFKQVENASPLEVRDIWWKVAAYTRPGIPPGAKRPSCVQIAGEMKSTIELGPLHFGVVSQPYDTDVRPPEGGWIEKRAQASADVIPSDSLRSEFILDTRTKDGRLRTSHVTIESSASYDGKIGAIVFGIKNDGEAIRIMLNIPTLSGMFKDVTEKAFHVKGGERIQFRATVDRKPEIKSSTIVFYGDDGKVAAQETAGFYVPSGGKAWFSDDALWERRR